ncbi:MAG: ParA family protein [Acidimicrobiales bacterium]
MIITVASFKGGVGKTTTAVHLAAFLQAKKDTLLIDGDPNRSASGWSKRGALPFKVVDERQAAKFARDFEHVVIDTQARPSREDLEALAGGCDLLVIPSTPDALSLDALTLTVDTLRSLAAERYRILLTMIPPKPSRDGDEARSMLEEAALPIFAGSIRRLVAFQKAALQGVPVSQVNDPRARAGWEDYEAVGTELSNGK